MRAAFGKEVETRPALWPARHKIDHTAQSIRSVDRALRPAGHLNFLQQVSWNVRKIVEPAEVERVHRHTVDLHQIVFGISAAGKERSHRTALPALREHHARQLPQQVHRLRFVPFPQFQAGNYTGAAAHLCGWSIQRGTHHPHRIRLRAQRQLHNRRPCRHRHRVEARRAHPQLHFLVERRDVEVELAAVIGDLLQDHTDRSNRRHLSPHHRQFRRVDDYTFPLGCANRKNSGAQKQYKNRKSA